MRCLRWVGSTEGVCNACLQSLYRRKAKPIATIVVDPRCIKVKITISKWSCIARMTTSVRCSSKEFITSRNVMTTNNTVPKSFLKLGHWNFYSTLINLRINFTQLSFEINGIWHSKLSNFKNGAIFFLYRLRKIDWVFRQACLRNATRYSQAEK
jgi:hypothetical protein